MNDYDKPHFIDRGDGKGLAPASTEEILPLVQQHSWHAGIAYFPDCPECVADEKARA